MIRHSHSRLPTIDTLRRYAFFLDFDGTLVDIAPRPDLVRLEDGTQQLLKHFAQHLNGAIAIVTGREIETVDRYLSPLTLPVAGGHGMYRRDSAGCLHAFSMDAKQLEQLQAAVQKFAGTYEGLLFEPKAGSVALHFRQRPDLEDACSAFMFNATENVDGFTLLFGKAVIEAKPEGIDKGTAIAAYMTETPFAGRRPVFAGDDVTDEHGFEAVNMLGGLTIKIGEGPTKAQFRADTFADFHRWLKQLVKAIDE